jgi:hypothetical protein
MKELRWLCRASGLYVGYVDKPYGKMVLFDLCQRRNKKWCLEDKDSGCKWEGDTIKEMKVLANNLL